jgi:hypothetical protein
MGDLRWVSLPEQRYRRKTEDARRQNPDAATCPYIVVP